MEWLSIETSGSRVSPWRDCLSLCDGHAAQQRNSKFGITRPPTDIITSRVGPHFASLLVIIYCFADSIAINQTAGTSHPKL